MQYLTKELGITLPSWKKRLTMSKLLASRGYDFRVSIAKHSALRMPSKKIDTVGTVTWTTKIGPGPSYTVDAKWLTRVSTVLDQITARNLSAIVNVHHDSWEWFDFTTNMSAANIKAIEDKFYALWFQIGTKLACKSSLVAFEPINEPKGTTKEHADMLNKMNAVFLRAINDAGGWNDRRVVTLVGLGEDSIKTSQWFRNPEGEWKNPWALQYHYYSPCELLPIVFRCLNLC
jgi:endoglucanase